MTEGVKFCRR